MIKVVIIGAGSGFGGKLSVDILSREPLRDSVIALCDIDAGRLAEVAGYVQRTIDRHSLPAKVICDTDRMKLLPSADFVVTSVAVGGRAYWGRPYADDIQIPAKYGVDQWIGDTTGPGGVFRFLRTAPVQLQFCRDIEDFCPHALLLNYTNPMAMLTWLHCAASSVRNVGLCHSVQGTIRRLSEFAGLAQEEISYLVAGVNHQSWVLEFRHKGKDAYHLIRKAMSDPECYARENIRFEIMRHFGYFPTESSGHNSEYLPYFRRTQKERDKFHLRSRVVGEVPKEREWEKDAGVDGGQPLGALVRSHEFASGIMEGVVTNRPFHFNGNVMNAGLIANLPEGCCVEVPCYADAGGIHASHVGALPAQCAGINRMSIAVQELAVKAFLNRDKEAAFHAVAMDPLTMSVADLDDIRRMFDEMWEAQKHLLKHFE